jgi:hypothetical protein
MGKIQTKLKWGTYNKAVCVLSEYLGLGTAYSGTEG